MSAYGWNGDGAGAPKAWYIDVAVAAAVAAREEELRFLQAKIYRGVVELLIRRIDAYDRFSNLC